MQVLCAAARDTLFWSGVAGDRLQLWDTTKLLVSTATKLYVNTYHFSEVDPRCLVNCTSKNALGEPLISLTATKCGLKGAY